MSAQAVGNAVGANPICIIVPCHRVVNRDGKVAKAFVFGGENEQTRLLECEGVKVVDGIVDLKKYLWDIKVIL